LEKQETISLDRICLCVSNTYFNFQPIDELMCYASEECIYLKITNKIKGIFLG